MASEVGSAYVTLIPSARGFASKMQGEIGGDVARVGSTTGGQYGAEFSKTASRGIGSRAKSIFAGIVKSAAVAGALAGVALGKLLIDSVGVASDLNESLSKSTEIFGKKSMPELEAFADAAATSMGQSKRQVLDAAATFATFGKSAGLSGKELVGFSTDFTGLASDLASFNNATPQEAIDAIGAALRGEAEPMRRFGVLLDDASMREEALRLGLIKTTKQALTPQQKVLAAQALIYKQTGDAQGDFARTSDGLANQQRIMAAQADNLKAKIGKGLLPVFTAAATVITTKLMPVLSRLVDQHMPAITKGLTNLVSNVDLGAVFGKISDAFSGEGWGNASTSLKDIASSARDLGPLVKELASQLPGINDILSVTAEVFGFAADHIDVLRKLLPFIIAGYIAVKVAQLAANIATAATIPMKIAEVAVNRQLIKSNKELIASRAAGGGAAVGQAAATGTATAATAGNTVAQNANNTAQRAGIVTTLRAKAAALASAVAQKAIAVATKAWAAAQWLINVAMSANPLGLIIAGIVALIAVIVLIATKTQFFQKLWDAAWSAIKAAAGAVFGFIKRAASVAFNGLKAAATAVLGFLKKRWPLLLAILTGPIGIAVLVIAKNWDKIKAGALALVGWFTKLPGRIGRALSSLGGALRDAFGAAFAVARDKINAAIATIVDAVRAVPGKIGALGSKFAEVGRSLIGKFVDALKGAGGLVSDIAGNIWTAVRGFINDGIDKINAALEFTIPGPGPLPDININPTNIPHVASGGRATGATLALIGEGREPETVLPDSLLRGLLERTAANASRVGNVRVFIGDRELTDIVRVEVDGANALQTRALLQGRR